MKKRVVSIFLAMLILVSSISAFSFQAQAVSYEQSLKNKGFSGSYISSLVALHNKYPKWEFEPFKTDLNWNDAVAGERSYHSKQVIQMSSSLNNGYYCSCEKCYSNGNYVIQEGKSFVSASDKAVRYYLDPRNWLDETTILQFESTAYNENQTIEGIESIISSTWMKDSYITYKDSKGKTQTYKNEKGNKVKYSTAIMEAAKNSSLSAYYLASKIVQEVGGAKNTAGGASGTYKGYEGIYNYYNIGAYTGAGDGLKWASTKNGSYNRPWTNPYLSIYNGASYIAKSFSQYQFTGYLQKFNVNKNSSSLYNHEYMSNIDGAVAESKIKYRAYSNADILKSSKVFYIPIFNNMPSKPCSAPKAVTLDSSSTTQPETTTVSTKVSGLKLTGSTTETLTYSWSKISGATKYHLYITNVARGTNYNKYVTTTSATLNNLTEGNQYSVKVRAYVNGWKQYSDVVKNKTLTGKVSGVKVTACQPTSVSLKWNKMPYADGYLIYQLKNKKYVKIKTVKGVNSTSVKLTNLTGGQIHKFKVCAYVDSYRPCAGSKVVSATLPPQKVSGVKLTPTKTTIKAKWSKVGGLADGYYVSFARDKKFKNIIATRQVKGQSKLTYTGKNLTKGRTYYVRVRSYKKIGKKVYYSPWSSVIKATCK